MSQSDRRYFILKWRKDMRNQGWPRHEVMRMPPIEESDYEILEENLTFAEADAKKKELEAQETGRPV